MSKVSVTEWSNRKYQADKEYLRVTGIKYACESMFKYLSYLSGEDKETPAKKFGRMYHCVMEGKDFQKEFMILNPQLRPEPDKTMASKANQEWKSIMELNAVKFGVELCSIDDYEQAKAMKAVLGKYVKKDSNGNPFNAVEAMIRQGRPECTFLCDDYLGFKVKVRPDLSLNFATVDFKSVADASPEAMDRAIRKFGWDVQIALYSDLSSMYYENLDEVPDTILQPFYIIAQEKKEPYDFAVYNVSGYYYGGKAKLLRGLDNIKSNKDCGLWGLIPQNEIGLTLNPPAWAYKEYGIVEDKLESEVEKVALENEWDDDEIIEES